MVQSHSLDLIIETRDARMPLTSINPAFERLLEQQAGGKFGPNAGVGATKRLIVYNKADLAQECFQEVSVLFCSQIATSPFVAHEFPDTTLANTESFVEDWATRSHLYGLAGRR
jgi:ribosome biogenesis GTPase A